jgi:hypothetical protein
MTREEAINLIADMDSDKYTAREAVALTMAIKALEQTSALDKARAEIAAYGSIWVEYVIPGHTDHDIEVIVKNVLRQAKEQVLTVIDKYRVESEDKA